MNKLVARTPWNRKIALRIVVAVVIALPILYIFMTHGITKYRLGHVEDIYTQDTTSWIVTLRKELPFEGKYGDRYRVCMDGLSAERVYVRTSSSGFDVESVYYNKDGEFISTWSVDDTGQAYQDGEYVGNIVAEENPARDSLGSDLHVCERIPAWFFNLKVDTSTAMKDE